MTSTSTPNFFIVEMVASRYGFDTRSELMFTVIPISVRGATMKRADMNWLEMLPGIVISPPLIFPITVSGGLPSFDSHFAPSDSSASVSCFMGLFLRLSSPVRIVFPSRTAEIAAAILIVVPEFDASSVRSSPSNLSIPFTLRLLPAS